MLDALKGLSGLFEPTSVREILEAAACRKVSRLMVEQRKLLQFESLARKLGVSWVYSEKPMVPIFDPNKGNHSSTMRVADECESGSFLVYIASTAAEAKQARLLDESSRSDEFGRVLGIPECCRSFYCGLKARKEIRYRDPFVKVLELAEDGLMFDYRLNFGSFYFGVSLLSFVPCSLRCSAAHSKVEGTLNFLVGIDRPFADLFVGYHKKSLLFSEAGGVALVDFEPPIRLHSPLRVALEHDVIATGKLRDLLVGTCEIGMTSKNVVVLYRDGGAERETMSSTYLCLFE